MSSTHVEATEVVALACLFLSLVGLFTFRYILRQQGSARNVFGGFRHVQQRVETKICEFRKELALYRQRCHLLDVYTPEYFNTFQAAGWNEFKQLLSDLEYADNLLDSLMESGDFEEAEALINLLMGHLSGDELVRAERNFQSLIHLHDWRKDASSKVLNIVQAIKEAAVQTKDLGIDRQRRRKPTLLAIDELQNLLPK